MTTVLCPTGLKIISRTPGPCSRQYHVGRAAKVTSTISRALRNSQGKAFETKKSLSSKDPRVVYKEKHGLPEYKARAPKFMRMPGGVARESERRERIADKKSGKLSEKLEQRGWGSGETDEASEWSSTKPRSSSVGRRERPGRPSRASGPPGKQRLDSERSWPERGGTRNESKYDAGKKNTTEVGRDNRREAPKAAQPKDRRDGPRQDGEKFERKPRTFSIRREDRDEARDRRPGNRGDAHYGQGPVWSNEPHGSSRSLEEPPALVKKATGEPITIPYTTPASEFLYGASVVEAALKSRRQPQRQLYKLYMYAGEERLAHARDAEFERLAKYKNIPIQRIGKEDQRFLDKLSGNRPHNGYVLEASPLPRPPVTSLGALTSREGPDAISKPQDGFAVTLDHQTKEEATVNGTADFIPTAHNVYGRKPLVLFLDSILDPQNMGGMIRTASFLGVTCVAIATKNCAPFSPVTLKASAGASENMTILAVKNPTGFLTASKAAGWKVYAAVAPDSADADAAPRFKRAPGVSAVSIDELHDPLTEAPSILMLGNEGDGIRKDLRNKADTELFIRGSARSYSVDSLNVNVALGMLCNAFIKRGRVQTLMEEERRALGEERRELERRGRELQEERRGLEDEKRAMKKVMKMEGELF